MGHGPDKIRRKRWTTREIDLLRDLYESGCSPGDIAEVLERTRDSVMCTAWRMGIHFQGGEDRCALSLTVDRNCANCHGVGVVRGRGGSKRLCDCVGIGTP